MLNPKWEMVGIFADEGITGTSIKHRKEFNKMIELCSKGKIDLIITKSASRFARNTLDAISIVRTLKEKGIGVLFENQGINTLEMTDEMIFTIFAAQAQAESETMSKNVAWGKRKSFKNGNVYMNYKRMLGYEEGEDKNPKVSLEEAKIVKRIYKEYLDGLSLTAIKNKLTEEKVKNASGKTNWSINTIHYILTNEKYIGDALLQKTFVSDCLTKKIKINNGELPKYYVHNHHEPIIERELFYSVQEEMARRGSKLRVSEKAKTEKGKYSGKYALTERLYCGKCGTRYKRITWNIRGQKKIVWRCISCLDYGIKYCPTSPSIDEELLHKGIVKAMNKADKSKEEFLSELKGNISIAIKRGGATDSVYSHESKIKELGNSIMDLISLKNLDESENESFEEKIKILTEEMCMHRERIAEIKMLETIQKKSPED